MVFSTYCAVFLLCSSSSCVLYVASFSWVSIFDPYISVLYCNMSVLLNRNTTCTTSGAGTPYFSFFLLGPSWRGRMVVCNYLCNQCLSLLMLWVRISIRARCTTLCDKVCQWLATIRWFSPSPPVSSTNKNWPPRNNWNIVESDVKHHQANKQTNYICM